MFSLSEDGGGGGGVPTSDLSCVRYLTFAPTQTPQNTGFQFRIVTVWQMNIGCGFQGPQELLRTKTVTLKMPSVLVSLELLLFSC